MTVDAHLRYPTIEVVLQTELSEYYLEYNTSDYFTDNQFREGVISFSTQNVQQEDSPVFSLSLFGDRRWDRAVKSNDKVIIRVKQDKRRSYKNPCIFVGAVSQVQFSGDYENNAQMYMITGQAIAAKAMLNFNVGTIREIPVFGSTFGWLDSGEDGMNFAQKSADDIAGLIIRRFIGNPEITRYNYGPVIGTLGDNVEMSLNTWSDEAMANPAPFMNYEGTILQFLDAIAAKPFNETFFEVTEDEKSLFVMRRTPFDKTDWSRLTTIEITSHSVIADDTGTDDTDLHSIFVVAPSNLSNLTAMDLGVKPKTHPVLIEKYGYKRLDTENPYLVGFGGTDSEIIDSEDEDANEGNTDENTVPITDITRDEVQTVIDGIAPEQEQFRNDPDQYTNELLETFPMFNSKIAEKMIKAYVNDNFTQDRFDAIIENNTDDEGNVETNTDDEAKAKVEEYTQRLFNWYVENGNFRQGEITVVGHPDYRVGSRLKYTDDDGEIWEYYIEGVSHQFSYEEGYRTVLTVTRGLPENGKERYTNLWGTSEDFLGGYLGEPTIEELWDESQAEMASTVGDYTAPTGEIPADTLALALDMTSKSSTYVFGGGRSQSNPLESSHPRVDCSSFVWWVYKMAGIELEGSPTGMNTDTIARDTRLKYVSKRGANKQGAMRELRPGDIVYFDTYKVNGHIGIYSGGMKFVGAQSSSGIAEEDMSSGYWYNKFNGHIRRYEE